LPSTAVFTLMISHEDAKAFDVNRYSSTNIPLYWSAFSIKSQCV
jgi:hypothetical protein